MSSGESSNQAEAVQLDPNNYSLEEWDRIPYTKIPKGPNGRQKTCHSPDTLAALFVKVRRVYLELYNQGQDQAEIHHNLNERFCDYNIGHLIIPWTSNLPRAKGSYVWHQRQKAQMAKARAAAEKRQKQK